MARLEKQERALYERMKKAIVEQTELRDNYGCPADKTDECRPDSACYICWQEWWQRILTGERKD